MRTAFGIPCRLAAVIALGAAIWCGCGREAHLAGKQLRHATIRAVSHYGVTLDQNATPEQVAFVALRAIRDDFLARTPGEREVALDKQFDVCAADAIASHNRSSLTRDELVHYVVSEWTPTVSHYAADFEVELDRAVARMVNRGMVKPVFEGVPESELAMEVADPGGDAAAGVVMLIWLARDGGYWRVVHFGFEPRRALSAGGVGGPGAESGRQ